MYPLQFEPLFQRYLWGGRRLADILGKPIGEQDAAESWEIVDHEDGQSVVAQGPLAGRSLHDVVIEFGEQLVGKQVWKQMNSSGLPPSLRRRFPLLFKFLDAHRNLSVQVHPDDQMGRELPIPDLGKTEAWVILAAQPGAKLYAGLKEGVSQTLFLESIKAGTSASMLHSLEPRPGDCILIEAGTMHAIGAGLLVAEIQQASNTTFRVFDWNRVDASGQARPLHIDQAMQATHFDRGPVEICEPDQIDANRERLVACDQFQLDRLTISKPLSSGGDGNVRLLVCTAGQLQVTSSGAPIQLCKGQTSLIPACLGEFELDPGATSEILEISIP